MSKAYNRINDLERLLLNAKAKKRTRETEKITGNISSEKIRVEFLRCREQKMLNEPVNRVRNERIHLLTGILKCPLCGAGMYGNKSVKHRERMKIGY